jgi:hypothetical protein
MQFDRAECKALSLNFDKSSPLIARESQANFFTTEFEAAIGPAHGSANPLVFSDKPCQTNELTFIIMILLQHLDRGRALHS